MADNSCKIILQKTSDIPDIRTPCRGVSLSVWPMYVDGHARHVHYLSCLFGSSMQTCSILHTDMQLLHRYSRDIDPYHTYHTCHIRTQNMIDMLSMIATA